MRKLTWLFTSIAAALCLFHFLGFDPKHMLLFSFSIPLWFLTVFTDPRNLNLSIVYGLTIASWAVIGFLADAAIQRQRSNRRKAG